MSQELWEPLAVNPKTGTPQPDYLATERWAGMAFAWLEEKAPIGAYHQARDGHLSPSSSTWLGLCPRLWQETLPSVLW